MGQLKAMISQPMAGKTEGEITADRDRAIAALEAQGYEVINTRFTDEWYSKENMEKRDVVNIPLCFLAKSLEKMSLCHAAYFVKGWETARGCRIEHEAAKAYGLTIIYEDKKVQTEEEALARQLFYKFDGVPLKTAYAVLEIMRSWTGESAIINA